VFKIGNKIGLGLDIGSNFVKLVELTQGMRKPELTSIAIAPLPPGTIIDGTVSEKSHLSVAVSDLLKSVKTSTREVAIALSNNAVIVRRIMVPEMTDNELDDHIVWEAEQYLPADILDDVHIDYNKINMQSRPGHMDVMLVAAKRSAVQAYSEVLKDIGLLPRIVDVDCFALLNVFNHNYSTGSPDNILLLNVGAISTTMVVVRNGAGIHTKEFEFGGKHFTEAIGDRLGISFDEAEAHKVRNTLREAFPSEFESIVGGVIRDFSAYLKESLDFFYSYNDDTPIKHIFTTGGGSRLTSFNHYLQELFSIKTTSMDIFNKISFNRRVFEGNYITGVMPLASTAVGLALRQLEA